MGLEGGLHVVVGDLGQDDPGLVRHSYLQPSHTALPRRAPALGRHAQALRGIRRHTLPRLAPDSGPAWLASPSRLETCTSLALCYALVRRGGVLRPVRHPDNVGKCSRQRIDDLLIGGYPWTVLTQAQCEVQRIIDGALMGRR